MKYFYMKTVDYDDQLALIYQESKIKLYSSKNIDF